MNKEKSKGAARALLQVIAACALLLVAWGASPRAAMAHAGLDSSTPAEGSTVQPGLTEITLVFEDVVGVDQSSAQVTGPGGTDLAGVTAAVDRADRKRMTIRTPALGAGQYTVKWQGFSEDDNNMATGSFSFTVAGAATGGASPDSSGASPGTSSGTGGSSLPQTGSPEEQLALSAMIALGVALVGLGMLMRGRRYTQG